MWTKVLGLDQGWSNNQVYWIIWKYDNQCFKTRGPDFNRIMVKCNNMFHGTDNTQRMKVIQWVVHLGWNIPNLGGYPEDYTEVYSRYRIIHDYPGGNPVDYIKKVHCNGLLFSEGIFTPGLAPAFLKRVQHPGFVGPGPAPAFLVIKFLHQRDILFSLVHVHSDIGYKHYKIVRDILFYSMQIYPLLICTINLIQK